MAKAHVKLIVAHTLVNMGPIHSPIWSLREFASSGWGLKAAGEGVQ